MNRMFPDLFSLFEHIPTAVFGTLVLLLPGFVAFKVDQLVRPQTVRSAFDSILEIVIYSVINDALWFPVFNVVDLKVLPTSFWSWLLLVAILGVSPAILAMLYAIIVQKLSEIGWVQSPLPRPWDHVFSRVALKETLGVILTLRDNRRIAGLYVKPRFASSYPADEQVLLGQVWHLDDTGQFSQPVEGSRGLLIDKADILTLEFFKWPPPTFGKPKFPLTEGEEKR